jgi:hypothetical protein
MWGKSLEGCKLLKLVKMVASVLASGPSSAKNGIPNRATDAHAGIFSCSECPNDNLQGMSE